jgi:hypothetical protein
MLLKGIFDAFHPHEGNNHLRERVRAIAFINEKDYAVNEINSEIKIFYNPHLLQDECVRDFRSRLPFLSVVSTNREATVVNKKKAEIKWEDLSYTDQKTAMDNIKHFGWTKEEYLK